MRIPDLVVVFASNHFFRKVFESCSKVEKNSAQESRKSCKIMQNHDFLSILKQFLLAHQAWACMTHAIKVLLLQAHVQLAGFCTCHYTSTCIQACTHISTCTYYPCSCNHIKICTSACIQIGTCSQTGTRTCIHCCIHMQTHASTNYSIFNQLSSALPPVPAPASKAALTHALAVTALAPATAPTFNICTCFCN